MPWATTKKDEVLDMLKEERKLCPAPYAVRIYQPIIAPHGKFITEYEFESIEEMTSWWRQRWAGVPEDVQKDWDERMNPITDTDMSFEVWGLVD